jgi:hypothetical protein
VIGISSCDIHFDIILPNINKVICQNVYVRVLIKRNGLYPYLRTYAVAKLVEALCYKPEGRGFESR